MERNWLWNVGLGPVRERGWLCNVGLGTVGDVAGYFRVKKIIVLTPGRENEEKYPKHRFLAILATLSPEIGQMVKSTILAEFYGASFGVIF